MDVKVSPKTGCRKATQRCTGCTDALALSVPGMMYGPTFLTKSQEVKQSTESRRKDNANKARAVWKQSV